MRLLTTAEVAEKLRICPQSVRDLCNKKKLKCIRHSERGKRLIPQESVEAYLAGLSDSVEAFTPVAVVFDDLDRQMKERTKRIRGMK